MSDTLTDTPTPPDAAPLRHDYPKGCEVIFTGDEIRAGVVRMAREIHAVYDDEELTVVAVLHGGLIFAADLMRNLSMPVRLSVVMASSYRGEATKPGELAIEVHPALDIEGRHLLLLDDILDTGRTLHRLREELTTRGPASIRIAALLDKPSRRVAEVEADFRGFEIPDLFVVGYGLDFNERYRNLPDIVALKS